MGDVILVDDEELGGGGGAPLLVKVRAFTRTGEHSIVIEESGGDGRSVRPKISDATPLLLHSGGLNRARVGIHYFPR